MQINHLEPRRIYITYFEIIMLLLRVYNRNYIQTYKKGLEKSRFCISIIFFNIHDCVHLEIGSRIFLLKKKKIAFFRNIISHTHVDTIQDEKFLHGFRSDVIDDFFVLKMGFIDMVSKRICDIMA